MIELLSREPELSELSLQEIADKLSIQIKLPANTCAALPTSDLRHSPQHCGDPATGYFMFPPGVRNLLL